jgi:peptidoglycan/LPS O-acetylase OafA/YrhL
MDHVASRSHSRGEVKFLSLEGLRGILALLVCVGHLGLNTVLQKVGLTVRFGLAVDVFFALSGFVLCYSNYFGQRSFSRFVIGRFARLYPLHLLTLFAMAAMYPAFGNAFSAIDLAESLTVLQNVGLPPNTLTLNFPAWSISVEIWVSVLFFFALQNNRLRLRLPLLLFVTIAPSLLVPEYITADAVNVFTFINLGIIRGIAGFSAGAIAFILFDRFGQKYIFSSVMPYAFLLLLAGFFFFDEWPYGLPVMFYAVLIVALVLLAANDRSTVLCTSPMVFLGAISFSVYLLHIPIYSATSLLLSDSVVRGAGKIIVLVVIIIGSVASNKWIERPAQRLILSLANKRQSHKTRRGST